MQRCRVQIRIGYELVDAAKVSLGQEEAAFVLREPKRQVRNRIRRGALKAIPVGRLHRVDPTELADQLLAGEDYLALEFLRALVEGRCAAPRLPQEDAQPPALADCLDLLDQGPRSGFEPEVRSRA